VGVDTDDPGVSCDGGKVGREYGRGSANGSRGVPTSEGGN
jgi:hypothetical protein